MAETSRRGDADSLSWASGKPEPAVSRGEAGGKRGLGKAKALGSLVTGVRG